MGKTVMMLGSSVLQDIYNVVHSAIIRRMVRNASTVGSFANAGHIGCGGTCHIKTDDKKCVQGELVCKEGYKLCGDYCYNSAIGEQCVRNKRGVPSWKCSVWRSMLQSEETRTMLQQLVGLSTRISAMW